VLRRSRVAASSWGPLGTATQPPISSIARSDHPYANAADQEIRAETGRIFITGIKNGDVPADDRTYLAQLVAARTGLSQADAEKVSTT
jgi:hypothetical protein